ncbi:MAG: DUF4886 domain-containing protein, partial [Clostridia bacterium]|nr:DUF4886 domain-containing protein [Clostridia bacterium]
SGLVYSSNRQTIEDCITGKLPDAEIGTLTSWLSPYAEDMSTIDSSSLTTAWKKVYNAYTAAGSTAADYYGLHADAVENNILNDDSYSMNIDILTAIYYANQTLGVSYGDLYRDIYSLTALGRVIAPYAFYTQFMDKEISAVNLASLSANANPSGSSAYTLTAEQKSTIIAAANYVYNNPWTIPGSDPVDPPEPPTSEIKKILIIGNSHTQDTFLGLPEVFRAEGYTDYTFATLYKAGSTINDHLTNINNETADYVYWLSRPDVNNGMYTKPLGNGNYATIAYGLQDQDWDLVIIQVGPPDIIISDIYATARQRIVQEVNTYCPNAVIGTSLSWLAPYADNASALGNLDPFWQAVYDVYTANGSTGTEYYQTHIDAMQSVILNDPTYSVNIATGTATVYASQVLGVASGNNTTDTDILYRDKVHASPLGRVIASYSFFAQFMGVELSEVKLSSLSSNANPSGSTAFTLTASHKSIIKESVNYAVNNPWVSPGSSTPQPPEPETPTSLASYKKILVIGNSHSQDIFLGLPEVFRAEGYTDYTFGTAYISGSSFSVHASNMNDNAAYTYFLSQPNVSNGMYTKPYNSTKKPIATILQDQAWDIVFLQTGPDLVDSTLYATQRQAIVDYVQGYLPNAKIGFSCSWLAPYSDNASDLQNLNADYTALLNAYNNHPNGGPTTSDHYNVNITAVKNNILPNNTYIKAISTGAAVFYENQVLHTSSSNLYRDIMHMNAYGRILVSYAFYAQYMGITELSQVKLASLSKQACPSGATSAYTLTAAEKTRIMQSVNYSINHPWDNPLES